jgi:hypothetical protein
VWPLPITTPGDLREFFDLAKALASKLPNAGSEESASATGKIHFWACDNIGGSTNPLTRSFYEKLGNYLGDFSRFVVVNPVLDIGDDSDFQGILTYDSVVLTLPSDPSLPAYVVSFLDDVCSEQDDPGLSGWLFKGSGTRKRLIKVVERLRQRLQALPTPPK